MLRRIRRKKINVGDADWESTYINWEITLKLKEK